MDPGLWELYEGGSSEDEVSIIVRMSPGVAPPPTIRIVSVFGDISTGRIRRGDIVPARDTPGVISLKAGAIVKLPPIVEDAAAERDDEPVVEDVDEVDDALTEGTGPAPIDVDGRGVVVGICDWGFDFTHANFRNADGTTRLICLWDQ